MRTLVSILIFGIFFSGLGAIIFFYYPEVWGDLLLPYPYREIYKAAWEEQHDRGCELVKQNRHFIAAVGFVESGHNPQAVSRAGARGIMQLIPSTAFAVARKYNIEVKSVQDLHDPEKNIRIGAYYLCDLNISSGEEFEIINAKYNYGPRGSNRDVWPRETRNHVRKVKSTLDAYNALYGPNDEGPIKPFRVSQPTSFLASISVKNLFNLLVGD